MREVLTLVAQWLADPADGLLAMMATVSMVPGDTMPSVVAITQEYADNIAAHRQAGLISLNGDVGISLLANPITHDEEQPVASGSQRRQGDVTFVIRTDLRHEDGAMAQRQTDYLCKAIERSLRRWRKRPELDRTFEGVVLLFPRSMERGKGDAPAEDNIITAGVVATWRFLDTAAEGL